MELWQALGVRRGDVVAFVGAGGKTSALLRVGRELAAHNYKVIATTTTKIATDEAAQMYAIRYNSKDLAVVDRAVNFQPFTFIYRSIQNNKLRFSAYLMPSTLMYCWWRPMARGGFPLRPPSPTSRLSHQRPLWLCR
jgi:hypothetical protein